MINKTNIRQEAPYDFDEVFEIVSSAFGQNNEAILVNSLRKNPNVFIPKLSIVATDNDKVIGHILFTKIKIIQDNKNETESLALAPIAVKPEFQNKGIGKQLIKHGLDIARTLQFKSVIVLGHENYYAKFGFVPTEKWNIKSPYNVPKSNFMALELVNEGLKNINGMVKYPEEFATL